MKILSAAALTLLASTATFAQQARHESKYLLAPQATAQHYLAR
jgi:hypothetical protein